MRCRNGPAPNAAQIAAFLATHGLTGMVTQTAPATLKYDCHGFTFTCGLKWINNDQVAKILADNGYKKKGPNDPVSVGDIAVYFLFPLAEPITHSGVVTAVNAMGQPTEIESKWGCLPRYKHAPGNVPGFYGSPCYYSTPRCLGNKLKCKKTQ